MNQFGEGEQAKICLEIMQRTGAHLELSLAKDQGLSIMVSGKLDAVMKARKDIVARLQTQVCVPWHGPSTWAHSNFFRLSHQWSTFIVQRWDSNIWSLLAFLVKHH